MADRPLSLRLEPVSHAAWTLHNRRLKHQKFESPADYFKAVETHSNIRKNLQPYYDARKQDGYKGPSSVKAMEATHRGLLEAACERSFKSMMSFKDADKDTKRTLVEQSKKISQSYGDLAKAAGQSADTRSAMKLFKRARFQLDPVANSTESLTLGWMVARDKPGGDKSLRQAYSSMIKSKQECHKNVLSALTNARRRIQRESSPMEEIANQE